MAELPSDQVTEARLRDYLAGELRRAEADYPHLARPARIPVRNRASVAFLLAAILVVVAVLVVPRLLPPVFEGAGSISLGDDGLPLSIDGEPVLRGGAIASHAGAGRFLAGGTLVLKGEDWTLVAGALDQPVASFVLDGAPAAPGFVRTSGAATVVRVGALSPIAGVLVVEAVAWRQPTKGRIPEAAVPPQGGDLNEALVPDFVSVWGADGVTVAGYIEKRYAIGAPDMTPGGTPSNPPQALPTPVYGEDLVTLVGHMVPGVGFVALGATETPVTASVSAGPSGTAGPSASAEPAPSTSVAPSTDPDPIVSPLVDCGRIGARVCEEAIVLARAAAKGETQGTSRIVVDDSCPPLPTVCDRQYPFDALVVFVTAGADTTGWIPVNVTGPEADTPTKAKRWLGDLPEHMVQRLRPPPTPAPGR